MTSCTGSGNGSSNIPLTITWYRNTTNSNNGGVFLVSRAVNQNALSETYQPSTATIGTFYYYAKLSWSAGSYCTSAGSVVSIPFEITVTAPNVVPSVTISSSTQTICAGTQVTFTATPVNGGASPSYQWKRNGSDIGTNNPVFTSSALTEGDVITCALTSNAQCITQSVVYSNSITMKVNPKPKGVLSGAQNICSGNKAELIINVTGTGPWSGTLTDGISFNGSENPVKVYVSPDKNTTYSPVSLNDAYCTSAQADLSGSARVTVLSSPTATIEINGTNPVCYNTTSGIKFTGPPDGTVTYKINDGDAITRDLNHGGNLQIETASLTANTTYSLITVSNGSCSEPANASVTVLLESTPPSWTTPAGSFDMTVECSDAAGLADAQSRAPEVSDNCVGTLIPIKTAGSLVTGAGCQNTGTYTNSWIVYDAAGNKSSDFKQVITVIDGTAPIFSMPENITIYKDKDGNFDASVMKTGDVENEEDNCSTGIQATYKDADPVPGSCEGSVIFKRTWSLTDNCGNHAEDQIQTINVIDNTPPTFTRPADRTIYKDVSCNYNATPAITGDVTDEHDNCSTGLKAKYNDEIQAGSCTGKTVIKRTWSLEDKCGNKAEDQIQTIIIEDNLAPVFDSDVANGGFTDVDYNPALCGAVATFRISANDNCSGAVTPVLSKGLTSGSTFLLGSTVVTYNATDECSNTSSYSFTVRVNKAQTTSELTVSSLPVSITPVEQQYSDQVKLSVVVRNGYSSCGVDAATGVNFYIGSQLMNSSPVPFTQSGTGTDMIAETTVTLLEPATANGQMAPTAPGTRTVSAKLVGVNTEKYNVENPASKELILKPEDARTTFTGTSLVATSSATSGLATVTLRTTIQDISALMDPASDSYPGDIRNARVRFINGSTAISGYLTPTLLNPGDLKTGAVSFTWTPNIGTANDAEFSIYTEVSGYYTNTSELTVVTVYKPSGDFITGGGYIIPQKTQGTYSSEKYTGLKTNFGFNIKYNKNGSNLQGNMNFIIRNWVNGVLHTYQVKANSMTSLGVDISKLTEQKAVFVSKANLTDITNPLMPVSLGGNLTLQINMTDKGEPGSNDLIGISLWDSGTLLYSNSWNGSSTEQQLLGGGNLLVHSGYSLNPSLTAPTLIKVMAMPEDRDIEIKTYPNPFTDHLYFEIEFPSKGKACLELFDMSGAKIATLLNEEVGSKFYRLEYLPANAAGGVIVYRLSVNGIVLKTGKVIQK